MTRYLLILLLLLSGLDLPIQPPRFGDPVPPPYPVPDEPEDDPRDTPPPTLYGEEIDSESESIVYVIDRSGSMNTTDGLKLNRLERAKIALITSIESIPEDWKFRVYCFGPLEGPWVGMREASRSNKDRAIKWLRDLQPRGGTPTGTSMAGALRENLDCKKFVLLSDGVPNQGPVKCREMIRKNNLQAAAIDTFGIQATGTFRAFLQGVAADSGGSYTDVP